MNNLSKIILAVIVIALNTSIPSTSYAGAAAKIKNASTEEVRQALDDTLKSTEAALNALKNNEKEDVIQDHISDARQSVKRVEINRLDVIRTRSSEKLKGARHALSKGEKDKALELIETALKGFQEMDSQF